MKPQKSHCLTAALPLAPSPLAPLGRLRAGLPTRMVSAPPGLGTDSTDVTNLADPAMEPAPPSESWCLMLSQSCAMPTCAMHKSQERSSSSLSSASVCCALPPAPQSAVSSSHSSARKAKRGGTQGEGGVRREETGQAGHPNRRKTHSLQDTNDAGGSKHKRKRAMQHASAPQSARVLKARSPASAPLSANGLANRSCWL
jgi:hypothetical protein